MAHKVQLFGKVMSASLTLCNLTSTEAQISTKDVAVIGRNYSADRKMCVTHGECRLQLVACWLTHFVAALCLQIIPIAWSENARADVFSTFFIPSLWESRRKNDLRRICRWAAAEGGRGMTEQGKSFDAGEAPQKNRRSAAKNWVSRVALYVGSHVETWDGAGPLKLHNEAQEQSGPDP